MDLFRLPKSDSSPACVYRCQTILSRLVLRYATIYVLDVPDLSDGKVLTPKCVAASMLYARHQEEV